MSVRSRFAVAALCGVSLAAWCGGAEAGVRNVIYGYGNGMTYRGESPPFGGCDGCGGGGCGGGWGKCGNGGGLFGGGCKSRQCGGGGDYYYGDSYDLAPSESGLKEVPSGDNPKLKPTPADQDYYNKGPTARQLNPIRKIGLEQAEQPTFAAGWQAYRAKNYQVALETLAAVVVAEPNNAAARYALALTQYDLGLRDAANGTLAEAVAMEAKHPVAGWGKLMERVQGERRVWLEAARR